MKTLFLGLVLMLAATQPTFANDDLENISHELKQMRIDDELNRSSDQIERAGYRANEMVNDLHIKSREDTNAAEEIRRLREDLKEAREQDALDKKVEAVESGEESFALLSEREQRYYLKKKHLV